MTAGLILLLVLVLAVACPPGGTADSVVEDSGVEGHSGETGAPDSVSETGESSPPDSGDSGDSGDSAGDSAETGPSDSDTGICEERLWYRDGDGDGWGNDHHSVSACSAPSGFVETPGDCDDGDAEVYPGAFDWHDGVDGDCDGLADIIALDSVDARLLGELDGDQVGVSVAFVGDIDGDGWQDLAAGGHAWPSGDEQGAAYLVSGPVSGAVDLSLATARIEGLGVGDRAGHPVAGAGDVNGDGFDDLLVAASEDTSMAAGAGAAFLLLGPISGAVSVGDGVYAWLGEDSGDHAAAGLSGGVDLTGDGLLDVVIGAFDHASSAGAVYLVTPATIGVSSLGDAPVILLGEAPGDGAGREAAPVGDTNGDGLEDLLVGARGNDAAAPDAGAAYLFLGPVLASGDLGLADGVLLGQAGGDQAGYSVAPAGDVDGDGHADLVLGAPYSDVLSRDGGAAYLVLGSVAGPSSALADAAARIEGDRPGALLGYDVHGVGDFDGDGLADLAVAAPLSDLGASGAGTVHLLLGGLAGSVCACDADALLVGASADAHAGSALDGGRDLNADGLDDLVIGIPGAQGGGITPGGAALVLGQPR